MLRRIGLALLVVLVWFPSAWGMEHHTNVLQDTKGNAIGAATVHVYSTGTTTHVNIYSDNSLTAKANPFSTSSDGTYDFYAANGVYDIKFVKAGVTFNDAKTRRIALFDVNDGGGGGGGGSLEIGSSPVTGGIASSLLYVGVGPTLAQASLTGIVVANGATAPTAFAGITCSNQFLRIISATGAGTCATVTSLDVNTSVWTGTASTGILKATSQGVLATATAGTDYTSPTSAESPTNKTINCAGAGNSCSNISLTTAVIGILQGPNGGTGTEFVEFTGPTTAKTFTLPDADTTILTTNAVVTLAQGGTSNASWTPTTCVRVNAGGTALESTGSDCAVGGAGAPTDATYWVGALHGDLSAEISLGALGTGLVINTAGTPSIYAGVTCTSQVLRVLSASGAGTCVTLTSAYVDTTVWTGTAATGILKASSQGVLAQATAGTDYVDVATANSWSDGVKQTFNPNGTNAGINVGQQAGDPSSLTNADIWYNSSTGKFRCRQGGTTFDCIVTAAVSSVDASGGNETTTGSPITATGTIRGTMLVNAQTGTTYTVVSGDRGKLVTHTNAAAIAVTLPQAGVNFPSGWYADIQNRGVGTVTITPTTSTIDGDTSIDLITDAGIRIASDGTNYFTQRGNAPFTDVDTLDTVFDRGKTIDGANSLANAVRIGDGVTPICLYTDATLGPQVRPCTDANTLTIIPANFKWSLWDVENAAAVETVDPDHASRRCVSGVGVWCYGANYRPYKTIWFGAESLSTDGTQCATPAEVTINSGPKMWTILCADNDSSTIYGTVKMPYSWDGGTVKISHTTIQTAVETNVLNADISAQCRGVGETVSSTWGSEVAMDDAAVGGNNTVDEETAVDVIPAGTCSGGDFLAFRYQIDAGGTTTAVATLHHIGFSLFYKAEGRSD